MSTKLLRIVLVTTYSPISRTDHLLIGLVDLDDFANVAMNVASENVFDLLR